LVARLHRVHVAKKRPYRIVFVPDPICWTEVPENFRALRSQRIRWQRGLGESLMYNLPLAFDPKSGIAGRVAFPFLFFFEFLGPLVEIGGYGFMAGCWIFGVLSKDALLLFLFVSVGMGIVLSVAALLLEEISYHLYPRFRDLMLLLLVVVLENLGYRQLMSWWRFVALIQMALGARAAWGEMRRSGAWTVGTE
jgi:cellulose synthase/poly-beta-1,6-N-acetylglucosamine synthase-like glycosyltransferase